MRIDHLNCYFCVMKFFISLLVFLFLAFLSTPTIIGLIDSEADTSYFYAVSEEEENRVSFDEIKSVALIDYDLTFLIPKKAQLLNVSLLANLNFTNLAHQIFSPPPKFI